MSSNLDIAFLSSLLYILRSVLSCPQIALSIEEGDLYADDKRRVLESAGYAPDAALRFDLEADPAVGIDGDLVRILR